MLATVRVGRVLVRQSRPAARVQGMKMAGGADVAGVAGLLRVRVRAHELSGRLICGPELGAA